MAYIYCHFKEDNEAPFYIGMGKTKTRPWDMSKRSDLHKNIANKYGVRAEIIINDIDWNIALWWEIRWIKALKNAGYNLANHTDGGEGTQGLNAHNKKSVMCLETGDIFDSATSAGKNFNLTTATITDVCHLKYRSANGYHFVFSNVKVDWPTRNNLIKKIENQCAIRRKSVKINKHHPEPINGKDKTGRSVSGPMKNARPVYSVTDKIYFPSASSAARYYNVSKSAVIELCLNKNNRKSVGGIVFKYIKEA